MWETNTRKRPSAPVAARSQRLLRLRRPDGLEQAAFAPSCLLAHLDIAILGAGEEALAPMRHGPVSAKALEAIGQRLTTAI